MPQNKGKTAETKIYCQGVYTHINQNKSKFTKTLLNRKRITF